MPCKKCGSIRIFLPHKIVCYKCEDINILDSKKEILKRKFKIKQIEKDFLKINGFVNYNTAFGSAIVNRELAAREAIYSVKRRTYSIKEWLAYTFLLKNLKYHKIIKSVKNVGIYFRKLLDLSRNAIEINNEIVCLQNKLAFIVNLNGNKSFVFSEKEHLHYVPEEIFNEDEFRFRPHDIDDKEINIEYMFMQESLMYPMHDIYLSEDISRVLKKLHHNRILPFIKNTKQANKFAQIGFEISNQGLYTNKILGKEYFDEGVILTDSISLEKIKYNLSNIFNHTDINWFFNNLYYKKYGKYTLADSIIIQDNENLLISIPLYSLLLLCYATKKWVKDVTYGTIKNEKGKIMEEYIFIFLNAYNLITKHPLSGKSLIRVPHPEKGQEIADIIGYNSNNLVVIECKFWNIPFLHKLENELQKFENNIKYITQNLSKFGFNKNLNVIPIFYTPYAPYKSWNNIVIVPSVFKLGKVLFDIFGSKEIKLIDEIPGLKQIIDMFSIPLRYPVDLGEIFKKFEMNKYWIQDGIVLKFDNEEILVIIDLPYSSSAFGIYFDITNKTYNELEKKNITSGDIIRFITVNLSGTWSITQMLYFQKIFNKTDWFFYDPKFEDYKRIINFYNYIKRKQ
ncbi:MAG: hypothetical protein HWN66_20280 [Candidatus Helarchaeota archaeon]|nr:hypothetical protein [Candidatus Helarchaeota archaeon]